MIALYRPDVFGVTESEFEDYAKRRRAVMLNDGSCPVIFFERSKIFKFSSPLTGCLGYEIMNYDCLKL